MKKKRLLVTIGLPVILIIVIGGLVYSYFTSASYFLSRLPEKYKSYPALTHKIVSANHEIKTLFRHGRTKTVYIDTVHNVLVIERIDEIKPEKEGGAYSLIVTYYRLDAKGNLLDTLRENSAVQDLGVEFSSYLLYDEYYTDYLRSGSLIKRPFIDINRDSSMTIPQLRKIIGPLRSAAGAVDVQTESLDGSYRKVFNYAIKGKIYRVFAPIENDINTDSKYENALKQTGPLSATSSKEGYGWKRNLLSVHLDYFLKQQHTGSSSTGFMASAPMSFAENWSGIGYFSINFQNDTLKFRHPMFYYPNGFFEKESTDYGNDQWGKLDFFSIPGFDFQLLTVGYDTEYYHELDGCYLILTR